MAVHFRSGAKPLVSTYLLPGSPQSFEPMTARQLEAKAKTLETAALPKLRRLPIIQAGSITDGTQLTVNAVLELSLHGEKVKHRFLLDGEPATAAQVAAAMPSPTELGKWAWWVEFQITKTQLL
jgi:hypothetical protein